MKNIVPWLMWLYWLEHPLVDQKFMGSILGQGTYPSCRFDPQLGHVRQGN